VNPSENDRLAALAKSLDQVIQWQAELDSRIRALEKARVLPVSVPLQTPPAIPNIPAPAPPVAAPPPIPFPRQPLPMPPIPQPAAALAPKPALETTFGLNWINRIAVITLLLGAAFLFKYGVDNNWIGPGARVLLGVAVGLLALVGGHLLAKRNQRVFAQGISGLGLALLYLAFYAAAALYHVVEPNVAFALMALTTIGAGALALKDNAQAIAVLGMIGGYLTPIALSTGEDHPWILFTYLFLLNLGGLVLARLRPWQVIEPLAFCATVAMYAGWAAEYWNNANRPVGTVFALAFYAQFAAAQTRIVWWAVQLFAPLTLAVIWEQPSRFLPFEFLLAAGGLVVGEWRKWRESSSWSLFCYWLPVWVWINLGRSADDPEGISAFLAMTFVLFLAWTVGWILIGKRPAHPGSLFVLAANPAAFFGTTYYLLNPSHHEWMGLFAALLGGLHLAISKLLWNDKPSEEWETYPGLMAAGVALAFVTLAVPIQFVGFRVTIVWALEGVAMMWIWAHFKTRGSGIVAGVILTLAMLRLFSVDMMLYGNGTQYQAILNARFLAFFVCAVCLWLSAWLVKQGPGSAIPYVAGHVTMLVILGIEIVGAVERGVPAADQGSTITVALSVLMATYAVILVTAGVVAHAAVHRILGLVLAAIVILKLYLLDVWVLGRGFRIAAFLGLGALLLAVSYLYSRFRPSVQKLWKD
jgi:hypothetical protein